MFFPLRRRDQRDVDGGRPVWLVAEEIVELLFAITAARVEADDAFGRVILLPGAGRSSVWECGSREGGRGGASAA